MALGWLSKRMMQADSPLRACAASWMSSSSSQSAQRQPKEKRQSARSWLDVKPSDSLTSSTGGRDELTHEDLRSQRPLLYHEQMEWLDDRLVRISKPSKNVMQSGTAYTNTWKIEFNTEERFEYWLMGWAGSSDPVSNLSLNFPSKEEAIAFCEKNQLPWYVEEQPERKIRRKSYADNFSWNKRTRTSNK